MTELLPISPMPTPAERDRPTTAPADDRFARLVESRRDQPRPATPRPPTRHGAARVADDRVRRAHARALSTPSPTADTNPDGTLGVAASSLEGAAVTPSATVDVATTATAATPSTDPVTEGVPAPGSLIMLPGGPATGPGWATTSVDGAGTGAAPVAPVVAVVATAVPASVTAGVATTVTAAAAPVAAEQPGPTASAVVATPSAAATAVATSDAITGAEGMAAQATAPAVATTAAATSAVRPPSGPETSTPGPQSLGAVLGAPVLAPLPLIDSSAGSGTDADGGTKRDGDDTLRSRASTVFGDARAASTSTSTPTHAPDLATPAGRPEPLVPSGAAAAARAMDVAARAAHGPATTSRLALELDDATRVAVRMSGRSVRVNVLADPNQRLGTSWNRDLQQGFRRRGLELDQRGADAQGRGRRRDRDEAEGHHAREGARAPRRITLPVPTATPTTTASPT